MQHAISQQHDFGASFAAQQPDLDAAAGPQAMLNSIARTTQSFVT
jgi:hypothetical protein